MAKSGQLDPNAVAESVSAYFGANALSQEQEDQAIAYVMHQLGAISGDMSDISKVRNLSEDQRKEYRAIDAICSLVIVNQHVEGKA